MRRLLAAAASTVLAAPVVAALAAAAPAAAAPGPASAPEYWLDAWRVPQLWAAGTRGQGITIAEIDTGVNASLPQLRGRVLRGKDFGRAGDGRVDRSAGAFGHGSAMASLMVARRGPLGIEGLAPDAELLPIAVPIAGTTDAAPDDHVPDAIRWAADHGADILTLSLAGARSSSGETDACPAPEQAAIFHALARGAVVFAAGGNRGPDDSAAEEPGACLGVVAVGAADRAGKVAAFSSRHRYLTLTAPGVDVASLSREPGAAYAGNGTSQATALAAASAALVWSAHPHLAGRQVVARILATLDHRGASPDPAAGYGALDTYRAVTARVPADAPNPVDRAAEPFLARYRISAPQGDSGSPRATLREAHPRRAGLLVPAVVTAAGLVLCSVLVVEVVRRRRQRGRVSVGHAREPRGSAR